MAEEGRLAGGLPPRYRACAASSHEVLPPQAMQYKRRRVNAPHAPPRHQPPSAPEAAVFGHAPFSLRLAREPCRQKERASPTPPAAAPPRYAEKQR